MTAETSTRQTHSQIMAREVLDTLDTIKGRQDLASEIIKHGLNCTVARKLINAIQTSDLTDLNRRCGWSE